MMQGHEKKCDRTDFRARVRSSFDAGGWGGAAVLGGIRLRGTDPGSHSSAGCRKRHAGKLPIQDGELQLRGPGRQSGLQRLPSGPATEGTLWKVGESREWLYHVCQAHPCNITNLAMLDDERSRRAAGRLLYRCTPPWLGNPADAEKALIDAPFVASVPPGIAPCARHALSRSMIVKPVSMRTVDNDG